MPWSDPRMLQSRVVQGLALDGASRSRSSRRSASERSRSSWCRRCCAIRLLEAVNYFEHWGSSERPGACGRSTRGTPTRGSRSTRSVGLSRHADHHAYASRPFHQLRYFEESPKLPYGYFGTTLLTLFARKRIRRLLAQELERRELGPFAREVAAAS
jgi:alkane 1-monooxygenase